MKKPSWKSPITVYELKRRNVANGGQFFARHALRMFGDTMKGFSIRRDVDPAKVVLTRKSTGKRFFFHVETGRWSPN